MAAVSVVESRRASIPGIIIDDPDEMRAIRLFRAMTLEQRAAWLVIAEAIVAGNRAAPWAGWKGGQA